MFIFASISGAKIDGLPGHVLRIGTSKASQKHASHTGWETSYRKTCASHGKSPGLNMSHPNVQDDLPTPQCAFSPFPPSPTPYHITP